MEKPNSQNFVRGSKIKPPSVSTMSLLPVYEKTKLLRTVLEREITRRIEHPIRQGATPVAGRSRIPRGPAMETKKRLSFTGLDQSHASSEPSLGILLPEEMDLGSFQHSSRNTTQPSNVSDGILNATQMQMGSFEEKNETLNTDYLIKRLQDQIVLHNTLLDASEKFPKSPSIENLVKQCIKGTEALSELRDRVAQFKRSKRTKRASLSEVPKIIRSAIDCADKLHELSEQTLQYSGTSNADLLNRSSLASEAIKNASMQLKEIERQWENVPLPDEEEDASLGLLHESEMDDSGNFLQNISTSLANTFEQVNQSIEEVLRTPNTASLNKLKTTLNGCKSLLTNLTLDQSQLFDETQPSFAELPDDGENSLLSQIANELDRSCKSEIEAFLEIWKSPEKERFLQISEHTINDLSTLRDETNEMLRKGDSSRNSYKREQLIQRLENLRGTLPKQPGFTSILLKDYLDEDDVYAEEKSSQQLYATSVKRTVQFMEQKKDDTQQASHVENRLQLFLEEMNEFQNKILRSNHLEFPEKNDYESMKNIESKLDRLMGMISELVKTLRSK